MRRCPSGTTGIRNDRPGKHILDCAITPPPRQDLAALPAAPTGCRDRGCGRRRDHWPRPDWKHGRSPAQALEPSGNARHASTARSAHHRRASRDPPDGAAVRRVGRSARAAGAFVADRLESNAQRPDNRLGHLLCGRSRSSPFGPEDPRWSTARLPGGPGSTIAAPARRTSALLVRPAPTPTDHNQAATTPSRPLSPPTRKEHSEAAPLRGGRTRSRHSTVVTRECRDHDEAAGEPRTGYSVAQKALMNSWPSLTDPKPCSVAAFSAPPWLRAC